MDYRCCRRVRMVARETGRLCQAVRTVCRLMNLHAKANSKDSVVSQDSVKQACFQDSKERVVSEDLAK